jgi:hypothetical protein
MRYRILWLILLVVVLLVGGLAGLYWWGSRGIPPYVRAGHHSFHPLVRHLHKIDAAFTAQGPVVWAHSYNRGHWEKHHQLDIIDPVGPTLLHRLYFDQTEEPSATSAMGEFAWTGQHFAIGNQYFPLQWRDARTGAVVRDEVDLGRRHPALRGGLAQVKRSNLRGLPWELITKDGFEFFYFPQLDYLLTKEQLHAQMQESSNAPVNPAEWQMKYGWRLTDDLRGELYLARGLVRPYEPLHPRQLVDLQELEARWAKQKEYQQQSQKNDIEYWQRRGLPDSAAQLSQKNAALAALIAQIERELQQPNSPNLKKISQLEAQIVQLNIKSYTYQLPDVKEERLLLHVPGRVFLNGEILHGDSSACLVKHTDQVGQGAKVLLTLVDRQGKVRWQTGGLRLAQDATDFVANNLQTRLQGQQLALVLNGSRQLGVALLDLATGRVVWEYLPAGEP